MVFITAMSSIFLTRTGRLQSGSAAWGLTQSLAITGLMAWAVRNLTALESQMMSVTRVSELTDIDSENGNKKAGIENKYAMPRERNNAGDALKVNFPPNDERNAGKRVNRY